MERNYIRALKQDREGLHVCYVTGMKYALTKERAEEEVTVLNEKFVKELCPVRNQTCSENCKCYRRGHVKPGIQDEFYIVPPRCTHYFYVLMGLADKLLTGDPQIWSNHYALNVRLNFTGEPLLPNEDWTPIYALSVAICARFTFMRNMRTTWRPRRKIPTGSCSIGRNTGETPSDVDTDTRNLGWTTLHFLVGRRHSNASLVTSQATMFVPLA